MKRFAIPAPSFLLPILALLAAPLLALPAAGADDRLLTRAERSGFTETTRFGELLEFLHVLEESSDRIAVEIFGESAEGRPLPLVVAGDPLPAGPEAVDRETTTVLFVQANIHAGEVEGKESCLMLLREIARGEAAHLLENTVLLVAPDFNADGNEKISKENRRRQHGPAGGVGTRANAQNLDLNRDFVKAESREVQAHLEGVLERWDPDILVDCHTTNGSLHVEPITWAIPHNPIADQRLVDYAWDVMMPRITAATLERHGYPSIPYGYWKNRRDPADGWRTFGPEPRYGTNYWGLRNRFAILIEMYAYADFETRVRACHAFLREIAGFVRAEGATLRRLVRQADRDAAAGRAGRFHTGYTVTARKDPITIMGYEVPAGRPDSHDPGERKDYTVPFFGRFLPAGEGRPLPDHGYVLPRGCIDAQELLLRHGIRVVELDEDRIADVEVFEIDAIVPSKHLFQGHRNNRLEGKWVARTKTLEAGSWFVPSRQPLAMLAATLLEPESGDGLAFWNRVDRFLTRSTFDPTPTAFPVLRWVEKGEAEETGADRATVPGDSAGGQGGAAPFIPGKKGQASLTLVEGIPLLVVEGTPEEMGDAYGTLLSGPINSLLQGYVKPGAAFAGGMEKLLAGAAAMSRHAPDRYRRELEAIAAAAGCTRSELLAGAAYPDLYRGGGCSTFAAVAGATAGGAPLLARNLDFYGLGILEKTSVVVVYRPATGLPFVSVGWPGLSGVLSGMNAAGLCCAVMEVREGRTTTDAMPSTFLFRRIMEEARDVESALRILEETPRAAGNNLTLLDTHGRAAVAEIGPDTFAVRAPSKGMVFATNDHREGKKKAPRCRRYRILRKLAAEEGGAITVDLLRNALIAVDQDLITVQSMIFEPQTLTLHLATGSVPSSRAEYRTFAFGKLLGQPGSGAGK